MELHLKKNQAAVIMAPAVDSATPEALKTGLTIADTAYYNDGGGGGGAWAALAITASFVEIGTTGMYSISLTAAELNHDLIMIKMSVTGMADSAVIIRTFAVDVDSLVRSTTPANTLDVSATGETSANLTQIGGVAQSATDLKDFADAGYDPVTNKVQGVVLVDTTTVNTDQRGTDGANTTTPPTVIAIRQEMDTNSADLNAIATHLLDIKGTAFVKDTHSLPQCLTASGFSTFDAAVDVVTVGTNNDKTGYALTQAFPANFADLAITLTTGKITVGTNGDKTGYSISGAKQTLDALNDIDGTAVTASNMRGTNSAMLATSAPVNFGAMVITAGGAVDSLVQGYLNTLLTETSAGRIAGNVKVFWDNADALTTKVVDNVGGGAGASDWTTTELANIRYRLGINGTQTAPTSNVPILPVRLDAQGKLDVNAEVDNALNTAIPGTPTANSINERIVAIDDLTQAGGVGDLAAVLGDTNELQTNQGNWSTATGFSVHTAAQVWSVATRGLTDKVGFSLSASGIDAIHDEVVEGTITLRQINRILLAAIAGKSAGGGTATITFRDNADLKARITATVNVDTGDRTAVTLDGV